MLKFMKVLSLDNRGVSALEYAILAGILIVVIVGGVTALGVDVTALFEKAGAALGRQSTP
ncbi:Flp family type IVb pilin [Candidimonas sp. SYP-B2681]|nr:Flp family type IVb pilin [Candidimonas sp. SYP-B2681]